MAQDEQQQAEPTMDQVVDAIPAYDESGLPDPFGKAPDLGI